jgi:hypothetical protein
MSSASQGASSGNGSNGHGPGSETETRATVAGLLEARQELVDASDERLATAFAEVAKRVLDPDPDLAADLALLPPASGLSPPMVSWALETTLGPARLPEPWLRLAAQRRGPPGRRVHPRPARLTGVLLAGNVFTACLRGLFLPLLARTPVLAKASSQESIFPRILARTLQEVDGKLGAALAVVGFPGGADAPAEQVMLQEAEVVSVYGGDRTVADLRRRLPPTTRLVTHGHGLGVAYVTREALADGDRALATARALALDVAAYDQRGCLSPNVAFAEAGGAVAPEELSRMVAEVGLAELAGTLPRGPLPVPVAAAQLQWRGVAAMRGALVEGDGYATSFEGGGPLRLAPGYRNLGVHEVSGPEALRAALGPIGSHLKAIGVAAGPDGDDRTLGELARHLPATASPRLGPLGRMQQPALDAVADGAGAFEGLVRWLDLG